MTTYKYYNNVLMRFKWNHDKINWIFFMLFYNVTNDENEGNTRHTVGENVCFNFCSIFIFFLISVEFDPFFHDPLYV